MYCTNEKTPVLSTKGSGKAAMFRLTVLGIIVFVLGIICKAFLAGSDMAEAKYNESSLEGIVRVILVILPMVVGAVILFIPMYWKGTYADVYADHIEGTGLHGENGKNQKEKFYLTYDKISNITTNSYVIIINAGGRQYKILSNKAIAEEMYSYCNKRL